MEQLNVHNLMHCHKKYFSVHLFCWIAAFPPYSLFFEKSETTLELRRFAEMELKRNLEKILLQFELHQATMASCSFKVHLEQNLQWVLSSKLVRLQPAWSLSFNRVNHHYWVKSNGNGNHDFILWIKILFSFDICKNMHCVIASLNQNEEFEAVLCRVIGNLGRFEIYQNCQNFGQFLISGSNIFKIGSPGQFIFAQRVFTQTHNALLSSCPGSF